MKVIFSRKGFDSGSGGCPSPIVDGTPLSLPIPTSMPSLMTFGELPAPTPTLVGDITRGKVSLDSKCHIDPELEWLNNKPPAGWRGSLGQVSAAQGHLERQTVGPGDLFLFWGLFRPVELKQQWKFIGKPEHRIFGWLQIDEVLQVGDEPSRFARTHPWLAHHPHMQTGWSGKNVIYTATDQLSIDSGRGARPGWGLFARGHRLSVKDSSKPSLWQVPDWLNPSLGGTGLTYNPLHRWSPGGTLQSAARGQEFVADIGQRTDAIDWLKALFQESK